MPSKELNPYLASLIDRSNEITAIWLLGSRANGTGRIDSDWDLLIFGNEQVLSELRSAEALNCRDFDVLVVYDGDRFESPWQRKDGSLSSWQWRKLSNKRAEYFATKPKDNDGFAVEINRQEAIRVWP